MKPSDRDRHQLAHELGNVLDPRIVVVKQVGQNLIKIAEVRVDQSLFRDTNARHFSQPSVVQEICRSVEIPGGSRLTIVLRDSAEYGGELLRHILDCNLNLMRW